MTLQLRPTFSESWYRVQNLKPKLRAGAQISRQFYRGERWYVVRDPAGNQYHRLSDAAYMFVGLLDGSRTIGEAWELVGGQLADNAPTQPEVIQILSQLYSANLIETNISPDATVLLRRHKRMMMHKAKGRLMNIMFPRIPLWDLDWFLKMWMPVMKPMLSWFGTIVWLVVVITAVVLLAPHWDLLWKQGKESVNLYANPINAMWLYLAFGIIKFIHELGHGFMCRRFGGEVHELGIMFLVLFPAPYVDASSAWTFKNKWHKVLVGAGGMIFEIFVAAICAFFWLMTKDSGGIIPLFLYNIMLIASFSTVVFNANPLLRYDGYYMLSDALEIPNLQHKSREYSLSLIKRFLFRVKWSQPLPNGFWTKFWMVLYFCLSGPYRVMVGLFIMIMVLFQLPEQIKFLGMIMGLGSIATFFIVPAYKSFTYLAIEPELHRKRGIAWAWTGAFVTAAVAILCFVRFPLNVRAEAVIQPQNREMLYAKTPGFLTEIKKRDGELVQPGDVIAVLRNPDIDTEIKSTQANIAGLNARLLAAQADDPNGAMYVLELLKNQQSSLDLLNKQKEDLNIKSSIKGRLIAPTMHNRIGAFLSPSEQRPVGMVASNEQLVGYALVDQGEVELIRAAEARAAINGDKAPYKTEVRMVGDLREDYILKPIAATLKDGDGKGGEILDAVLKPAGVSHARSVTQTTAGGGIAAPDPRDPSGQRLTQEEFEYEIHINNPSGRWQPNQRAYVRIQMNQGESLIWQGWRRLNQLVQTTRTS
jgi:putative peptide zinc metalloprotease protein